MGKTDKETQITESLTDVCQAADKTMRSARKTKDITTRLNANRCLILSRYFKFLNAACPNAVEKLWGIIVKNATYSKFELEYAEAAVVEELSTFREINSRAKDISVKQTTDDVDHDEDEEEEEDDHD